MLIVITFSVDCMLRIVSGRSPDGLKKLDRNAFFMPFHQADIVPIQQPVDLFAGERHDLLAPARPRKFLFRQAFVVSTSHWVTNLTAQQHSQSHHSRITAPANEVLSASNRSDDASAHLHGRTLTVTDLMASRRRCGGPRVRRGLWILLWWPPGFY